jgi:hypothetical protein
MYMVIVAGLLSLLALSERFVTAAADRGTCRLEWSRRERDGNRGGVLRCSTRCRGLG